jgi:hypothetical protein
MFDRTCFFLTSEVPCRYVTGANCFFKPNWSPENQSLTTVLPSGISARGGSFWGSEAACCTSANLIAAAFTPPPATGITTPGAIIFAAAAAIIALPFVALRVFGEILQSGTENHAKFLRQGSQFTNFVIAENYGFAHLSLLV